ncbi:NTP transferase domain-containing protein [Xenorhabdus sp. Flor]|uniref:NTP transferase domain-containing protein n=1 Tax=Xenorhabdus cabanillasii TaxID=351673 RepID=UPI00199A6949|nr:NTP transferase domain-containing protein [Xenorhabdus sp. Flor]MBD2816058.1 NTP transferase domain-containing protein [Xenorhabdus sp. Flor]
MYLIITMAGRGTRLKRRSPNKPKFMVKINGISLLQRTLNSSNSLEFEKIFVVSIKNDKEKYQLKSSIANALGNDNIEFIEVDEPTDSQVHSAYLAIKRISKKTPVYIQNIDTQFTISNIHQLSVFTEKSICLPIFESRNPDHSYIRRSSSGVKEVCEGFCGSICAVSGFYGFSDAIDLANYMLIQIKLSNSYCSELKFSKVINSMLREGYQIVTPTLSECIPLGTELEINNFLAKKIKLKPQLNANRHCEEF